MVEYELPDRDGDGKGEVIALVTTITEMTAAPAPSLAQAYHQRWEHETGNKQLKTHLRGPSYAVEDSKLSGSDCSSAFTAPARSPASVRTIIIGSAWGRVSRWKRRGRGVPRRSSWPFR